MNAAELMESIIEYGADKEGIRDRFGDNAELYEACFRDFLEEDNFEALRLAMAEKNYKRAFDAAHALKGISGNLGVSAFYDAVCALVETLRTGGEEASGQYAEVLRQKEALLGIAAGEKPVLPPTFEGASDGGGAKKDRFVYWMIIVIVAALLLISFLLSKISTTFRENVLYESGQHLTEMSNQIRLYVEEQVANDWRVAYSVSDSLTASGNDIEDYAIFDLLQRKQRVWDVSELMLYTENGYCVYSDGATETNDVASELIDQARRLGKSLTVVDSRLIYTVPVETELRYGDSRIAAISVVQDMKTFLDDMNFSSFDEKAWMYLTEDSGIVISALTNPRAVTAFNFKSIVDNMEITPLGGEGATAETLFSSNSSEAFLITNGVETNYAVSVPIDTGAMPLRLFYLAPEGVVNNTTNGFSRRLTLLSMLIILSFAALAFLTFFYMYSARKKLFDKAITARDRMFDLLVKNTRTAFALFSANKPEPDYVSSNVASVIGDEYWALDKTDEGYSMRNEGGTDTSTIRCANEMMRGWDGKSSFKSGYIRNEHTATPNYFEYQLYPIDGEGKSFVGIAQDVTQAYEREEATRNAMEMATRANDAKSQFLSNMSHDIRTPMNAIMNMTNFALESIDQPKKLGVYLHTIRESSEHLLQLINDVLDMSRIESGQTVVASAPFNIREIIQRQVDMVRPLCAAKGQTLITDFDGLRTLELCGDALKLSQIIMNLLGNAVKFTPDKGAVRFTAREIPSLSSDLVDVRFTIEDNGIGISEENRKSVFAPFFRSSDKKVSKIEGTGLGLSICKSYVEAMGGTIWLESEEGEGSTFTVELFFRKAEANFDKAVERAVGEIPFLGMHCLVVEDNRTNQIIAKSLLERLGFIVDLADDGSEGVKEFLHAKPDTYDVIYMDIRMPVMDGYQAAMKIRASEHPQAASIPIVAMTANVYAEDIEHARLAGMDAFIGKPVVSFDLIEETQKAINKKGQQQ